MAITGIKIETITIHLPLPELSGIPIYYCGSLNSQTFIDLEGERQNIVFGTFSGANSFPGPLNTFLRCNKL